MDAKGSLMFSRRQKMGTTLAIYFGNICLAIGMNSYSPAVVDFSKKYNVEVDQVSVVFTVLTISYMIGALLTSFVYKFFNRQLGVTLSLAGIGTALYLTPHCPSLTSLYAVAVLLGLCNGLYNASQVVWVIEMWQAECGPFIQGQHFFYAVGSLVPSLVLGPFLTTESASTLSSTPAPSENSLMWIPFTIIGVLVTIAVIIQIYLFIFQRYTPPPPEVIEKAEKCSSEDSKPSAGSDSKYLKLTLIVLAAIFLGFYQGMEMVTMQFISTFAQFGEQNLSDSDGAKVMTALTGSYAISRGIGILANLKFPAQFILAVNFLFLFVSSAVLILFGNSMIGLWAGVVLLGIGFSTINPSFTAYIERHLNFTNAIGSLMLVSGSAVASIFPIVIGQQIVENASVLIYVNLFSTSLITIALIVILMLTYRRVPIKL